MTFINKAYATREQLKAWNKAIDDMQLGVFAPEILGMIAEAEKDDANRAPSLTFSSGKCVEAHAPVYPSAILTGFFVNVAKSYKGKTPEEISIHALKWAEAIRDMPAPKDMPFGWALTKNQVRMDMESFAEQAEAARKEQLQNSKLEMTG